MLTRIAKKLSAEVDRLDFSEPVTHVYNPLSYAWKPHRRYLELYGAGRKKVLMLGMNPGPFGMAQTGVPFGEVAVVRDWLGIDEPVAAPPDQHPKRPIVGFDCERSEVSGRRLWGWARRRFGTPRRFFRRFFVYNFCPLVFMEASGRNVTPDKLPAAERTPLFDSCDRALVAVVECLQPELVIGVGAFAETRARKALAGADVEFGRVLHPSPASPLANKGWEAQAERELAELGVDLG